MHHQAQQGEFTGALASDTCIVGITWWESHSSTWLSGGSCAQGDSLPAVYDIALHASLYSFSLLTPIFPLSLFLPPPLSQESVQEYLTSNITLLKWMIADGYGDKRTMARRIAKMEAWLEDPQLLEADKGAKYAAEIHINLNDIKVRECSAAAAVGVCVAAMLPVCVCIRRL